jgi:hypothetical protein
LLPRTEQILDLLPRAEQILDLLPRAELILELLPRARKFSICYRGLKKQSTVTIKGVTFLCPRKGSQRRGVMCFCICVTKN